MSRKINFGAGPSAFEMGVLEDIQNNLLCYKDTGVSVLEMIHRTVDFENILKQAEQDLISLLKIPKSYKVLFLQGGASGQFSAIPLNLLGNHSSADYIITGLWSQKASQEATKYCKVHICASNESSNFTTIPETFKLSENPAYVYYCDNETAHGVQFKNIPDIPCHIPLVGDFSSSILSSSIDVTRFGMIFAGAQKNLGTAGVTVVIVREDLLDRSLSICPSVWNYKIMSENQSMYNTPPCFNIYVTGLVLASAKRKGIDAIEKEVKEKASMLYSLIDAYPDFYITNIPKNARSSLNVVFKIKGGLEKKFIDMASQRNIFQISGYRTVGGIRISLYNAISIKDVEILKELMVDFMNSHI